THLPTSILTLQAPLGHDDVRLTQDVNIPGILQVFINSVFPVFTVEAAALQQIIVNTLAGNDTVNLDDTSTNLPVTVNLSSGTNTVNINPVSHDLGHIQGSVIVNGGSGSDTLNVFDQAASGSPAYTLTSNSVSRSSSAVIGYAGIDRI